MIRFVNVDLVLEGAGVGELLEAWDGLVFILHRTRTMAVVELSRQPRSEEAAISTFQRLIRALPPAPKRRWEKLKTRVFDVGFERPAVKRSRTSAAPPEAPAVLTVMLNASTVAAAAEVGAGVMVTIYPA